MKDLKFICVQPCDEYYVWQTTIWLESLKKKNLSDKAVVIIFTPSFRQRNINWEKVQKHYPETEFVFYKDEKNEITNLLKIYISVLRPYCLKRYFEDHPEMSEKTIFYCDNDIVFLDNFDISHLLNDEICYLSDTNSYINSDYFDSKVKDVIPEKLEIYKKRDVLDEICKLIGINREIAVKNKLHSGGAQYLIKKVDSKFWEKVMSDCLLIRVHLQNVNKEFFESENKGFQSWCADMWAVLWNLWFVGKETKVVDELKFAWAPDSIERLQTCTIYHNAGITGDVMSYVKDNTVHSYPTFFKGKFHSGNSPFENEEYLNNILNNEVSKTKCTSFYVQKLLEIKQKYVNN